MKIITAKECEQCAHHLGNANYLYDYIKCAKLDIIMLVGVTLFGDYNHTIKSGTSVVHCNK